MAAFIITRDYISDKSDKATGVMGPSIMTERDAARLRNGEGTKFRLLDDDGHVYYHGRRLEDADCEDEYADRFGEPELAPLDCWGTPNAGCTEQQEKDEKGNWVSL